MIKALRCALQDADQALDRALANRTVDIVLRLVAVISLGAVIFVGYQQHQQRVCFEQYADDSAIATKARAEALEDDLRAQDELYRAIANDPQNFVYALERYNDHRLLTDNKRKINPPPLPPSAACG